MTELSKRRFENIVLANYPMKQSYYAPEKEVRCNKIWTPQGRSEWYKRMAWLYKYGTRDMNKIQYHLYWLCKSYGVGYSDNNSLYLTTRGKQISSDALFVPVRIDWYVGYLLLVACSDYYDGSTVRCVLINKNGEVRLVHAGRGYQWKQIISYVAYAGPVLHDVNGPVWEYPKTFIKMYRQIDRVRQNLPVDITVREYVPATITNADGTHVLSYGDERYEIKFDDGDLPF